MVKELGDYSTQISANIKLKNKIKLTELSKGYKSVSEYLDKLIEGL